MDPNTPRIMKDDSTTRIVRRGLGNNAPQTLIKLCIGSPSAQPMIVNVGYGVIIGRAGHDGFAADINLTAFEAAQNGVSRMHASLEVVKGALMVADLGSRNGTFLNTRRLVPGKQCIISDGDQLRLGKLLLYVFYAKDASHV